MAGRPLRQTYAEVDYNSVWNKHQYSAGILKQSMGARNQVGI